MFKRPSGDRTICTGLFSNVKMTAHFTDRDDSIQYFVQFFVWSGVLNLTGGISE
jgi:hypothetical protein